MEAIQFFRLRSDKQGFLIMDAAIVRNQGTRQSCQKILKPQLKKSLKSSQAIPAVILIVCVVGPFIFQAFSVTWA
jgi:uncharacterized membrane protein